MTEKKLTPQRTEEDIHYDSSLRPRHLEEYVGQSKVKENLKVFISAARQRGEALDHLLFYGPPGLGKTTLAYIISNELGVGIKSTSGPVIERAGDLAAILTNLEEKSVLFIDEIHRLNPIVEEILYPAMEDFQLDILIGQGPSARTIKLDLPHFTLIGATTRTGLLSSPLRDRFGFTARLDYYNDDELARIVERSARILTITIDRDGAKEIARRSRGTPRISNRLLRRVRDYAQVKAAGAITSGVARESLSMLEVDDRGFDTMDRKILLTIIDKFGGGPVGLETLSAAISEEKDTIEEVYEPFLIQGGFLDRTPRGRVATRLAYVHLGKKYEGQQGKLLSLVPLMSGGRSVFGNIIHYFTSGPDEQMPIKIGVGIAILIALYLFLRVIGLFLGLIVGSFDGLRGVVGGLGSSSRRQADILADKKDFTGAGELYRSAGEMEKAADMFVKGKSFSKAGEIYLHLGHSEKAAQMYERAGDLDRAAQVYSRKGMYAKAAEVFGRAHKYSLAGEMYEKGMNFSSAGDKFAEGGYNLRAGQMYEKVKAWEKAAAMYEKVYWEDRLGMKDKRPSDIHEEMSPERRKQIANHAYKSGEMYEKSGNRAKAIAIFSEGGFFQKAAEIALSAGNLQAAADLYLKDHLPMKAAEVFDRMGDTKKAAQLRAEALKSQGDIRAAIAAFEKADQYEQAVELYRSMGEYQKAGNIYMDLHDFAQAGEMFIKAKDLKGAAEAYAKGRDFATAAMIFQRLGDIDRQSEMLELGGHLYEAAVNYYTNKKADEAIDVLTKISEGSPDFPRACILLGDIYREKNELTHAISKYQVVLAGRPITKSNISVFYNLAVSLEGHGEHDTALKIYRSILTQDHRYADVAEKVKLLEAKAVTDQPTEVMEPQAEAKAPPPANGLNVEAAAMAQEEGRFTLLEEIGRGGMGTVHKAKDNVLDRLVAMKVIEKPVGGGSDAAANFLREARAAAKLIHPNIVTVFDADQDEETGDYYIVMELVEGRTVKQILSSEGKLPVPIVVSIGIQVCRALDFAHSRKVIHRDIKNSNIMWTSDKIAKLMDFGLARIIQEMSSFQTIIGGTPHYMSPEQVLGEDMDARSDLYSFGVSLYEMVTGQVPFTKGDVGYHHIHTPAPSPKSLVPEMSDALERAILKCLEKSPEKRFQTSKELQAALDNIQFEAL